MAPFLGFARTRSFRLLHPLFRIDTEDQPQRPLVAVCQLHNYIRDLPRIAFRTSFEARRAGLNAPELLPDYEASVGSIVKMLRGRSEYLPAPVCSCIERERLLPMRAAYRNQPSLEHFFASPTDVIWPVTDVYLSPRRRPNRARVYRRSAGKQTKWTKAHAGLVTNRRCVRPEGLWC